MSHATPGPLSVTVIGGYLGAGKTTVVNHVLRHAQGRRLAVLVNEFGALPIDADLIEGQDDGVISIAGGCICCSFGDNLIGALMDLAGLSPRPDHILVEASGVAIPSSISASVALLEGFTLAATVVLADAETIQPMAQDAYLGDTILRQLQDADLVLATKTDLAGAPMGWLRGVAPGAEILPVQQGRVQPDILLGPRTDTSPTAQPHSDTLFETMVLPPAAQDVTALAQALATGPFGVIRAKGFVPDPKGQIHLVQIVGQRFDITPGGSNQPNLVCIGLKGQLDRAGLSQRVTHRSNQASVPCG